MRRENTVRRLLRPIHRWAVLLAASMSAGFAFAQPASVNLPAVKDNTLYDEFEGAISNGKGQHFFVGTNNSGNVRRGVIAFDTSIIPPGSTITAATLRLSMSRTRAGNQQVTLHRLTTDWGEGDSRGFGEEGAGNASEPGDATWIHRFYNTVFWSAPGGDFISTPSATTSVGGVGFYTWSGSGVVANVQAWVNDPSSNFGWLLKTNELSNPTAKRFDTRQNLLSNLQPSLSVTYTPPPTAGACCLLTGACVVTTSELCAARGGSFQGAGTTCSPNPCAQPTGACCLPSGICTVLTQPQCLAQSGVYQGDSVSCSGVSCPIILTPFVDPLPIPGIMQPTTGSPGDTAHYDIAIREVWQRFHRDLPVSRVWGYQGAYPANTIEARRGRPVTVTWTNDIRDEMGDIRTSHILNVDTCLHGPDMFGEAPLTVTHLHGGVVSPGSDGPPEEGVPPGESSPLYTYPNNQRAGTLWYHDHALGITRLNVYMGLAGFYLLRDDQELALNIPRGEYEIPLAIQDRTFKPDGSLSYPDMWHDHFFGEFIVVNGKVWPFLEVNQGKYRFRLLNGSGSRAYTLSLSTGAPFWQIGTDLGLLPAPVARFEITLLPGERADVIMDFASLPAGTEVILNNSAPAPYPGDAGVGVIPNVMKFIVRGQAGFTAPLPTTLVPVPRIPEARASRTRDFVLQMTPMQTNCGPMNMWTINGLGWDDITEYPRADSIEIWRWINRSGFAHPMHMHLVSFQILDRQDFAIVNNQIVPVGPRIPPLPNEAGWKDTVNAMPNQITRVITRFEGGFTGTYPYHCHILEHEDNEMMRQFTVVCPADYDDGSGLGVPDGGITIDDLLYYLDVYSQGAIAADLDDGSGTGTPDGGVTIDDLLYYLVRYAGGC
jgi:spore coat protein A